MLRRFFVIAAVLGAIAILPQTAHASGYTVGAAKLHAGPDQGYPTLRTIPNGTEVLVHACLKDWTWCEVTYKNDHGWLANASLTVDYDGNREKLINNMGAISGLDTTEFNFDTYWDANYHDRPFYAQRDKWKSYSAEEHKAPSPHPKAE
jgi:uncharacterized protein YraI